MRLKLLQVEMEINKEFPVVELREFILTRLENTGKPLRWAITSCDLSVADDHYGCITVDAVVIIP